MYLITTPWWVRAFYPKHLLWEMGNEKKALYLTFDDGPHELATPFVLQMLHNYRAKASFFCIGKNVAQQQTLYEQIILDGHTVGNHTEHHLNGWETDDQSYLSDIQIASSRINSNLFRPPYGRIKKSQIRLLQNLQTRNGQQNNEVVSPKMIVMWTVLSGDFDKSISPETCLKHVIDNAKSGSIIVFHDSQKAWKNLNYALPKVLSHFSQLGYTFEALPINVK